VVDPQTSASSPRSVARDRREERVSCWRRSGMRTRARSWTLLERRRTRLRTLRRSSSTDRAARSVAVGEGRPLPQRVLHHDGCARKGSARRRPAARAGWWAPARTGRAEVRHGVGSMTPRRHVVQARRRAGRPARGNGQDSRLLQGPKRSRRRTRSRAQRVAITRCRDLASGMKTAALFVSDGVGVDQT